MTSTLAERNKKALSKRRPGDIIFFHPMTFNPIARLILVVTGQYYHHGAIVIGDEVLIEADPTKGVHYASIEDYLDSYELDLFRLKDPSKATEIVASAKSFLGWSYDYRNVIWAGLGYVIQTITGLSFFKRIKNPLDTEYAVDSEEYIDAVFYKVGIDLVNGIPTTNVTAQVLSESRLLEKIV